MAYLPYGGMRLGEASTLPTDYTFTGQRNEAGLGLMHYGARFYSPRLGRFVSADTIVPQPGEPQALNRYSYTANNPLNLIDPTGHDGVPWWLEWTLGRIQDPRTWLTVAAVSEAARIAQGGEVTDEDWRLAAEAAVPATADASVSSLGGTASVAVPALPIKGLFATASVDLVTTSEGEVGAFLSLKDDRLIGRLLGRPDMGQAQEWLQAASDEVAPIVPPQLGGGLFGGPMYGDAFHSDKMGVGAYAGPFINYGIGAGPSWFVGGNAFQSFDTRANQPTQDVVGGEAAVGGGFSPIPFSVNINATYSIPLGHPRELSGPQLLGCRLLGGCGR